METEYCGAKNGGSNRAGVTGPLPKVFKDADIIGEELFPVAVTYKEKHVHKANSRPRLFWAAVLPLPNQQQLKLNQCHQWPC